MSKQTVKVRAKLRKGSLRRKTPAHPPVTSAPQYTYAADAGAEKQKRVRLHFGDGNSMLVSPEFAAGWQAGYSRGARKALMAPSRDICLNDLETPRVRWERLEGASMEAIAAMKGAVRPSILSRLKAWWRR